MLLDAVTSTCWYKTTNHSFDGKSGIWTLITKELTIRLSHNQSSSNIVTKIMTSVTSNVYRQLQSIRSYLISNRSGQVTTVTYQLRSKRIIPSPLCYLMIQNLFLDFQATDLDIRLVFQPPNSPDMNMLDI